MENLEEIRLHRKATCTKKIKCIECAHYLWNCKGRE